MNKKITFAPEDYPLEPVKLTHCVVNGRSYEIKDDKIVSEEDGSELQLAFTEDGVLVAY